ncbi:MBL fold metallo-hydrolase [Celerinatantimonas diazotrophica]|uniref:Glyoxylase-like metal-dependent hydrolase (Beta-lactamase superfamily II) n=1 Tax=Celerinatantimonas diazotrophica TaxID=412034 RepID=A0A4V6NE27_9GAMM|nr:MBL fold metallo-hydrolase [Celerinatantimonas diazotrophica]TCK47491.1 glyoxylase-like metal-dependent hydrolase (beta-lactamase superfamily II) [Celerinatantimonas diazotrophica]CAG9296891.1 Hydroxyacylglutathione hydrolase GloC [Celerinatantimonas diazotrophica]
MAYQTIPVTPFSQNCSLIWCDKTNEAAIVDPGGDAPTIIAAVERKRLEIKYVLLTHGHLDHAGATLEIAEYFKVPVWGPHIADKFWLDSLAQQCQLFGFLAQQSKMFGFSQVEPVIPDRWLNNDEAIHIGQLTLQVKHCPGHTPGHVIFIDNEHHLAWVGDVLFHNSVGRTDFPQGSHPDLIASIKNNLLSLDDDYVFIPGHGPESTIGAERSHNPFLQ